MGTGRCFSVVHSRAVNVLVHAHEREIENGYEYVYENGGAFSVVHSGAVNVLVRVHEKGTRT